MRVSADEGDEDRRRQFEDDYRDFIAGRATIYQQERVRFAFAWEND